MTRGKKCLFGHHIIAVNITFKLSWLGRRTFVNSVRSHCFNKAGNGIKPPELVCISIGTTLAMSHNHGTAFKALRRGTVHGERVIPQGWGGDC